MLGSHDENLITPAADRERWGQVRVMTLNNGAAAARGLCTGKRPLGQVLIWRTGFPAGTGLKAEDGAADAGSARLFLKFQFVQRFRARHRLRCQDTSPCFPA